MNGDDEKGIWSVVARIALVVGIFGALATIVGILIAINAVAKTTTTPSIGQPTLTPISTVVSATSTPVATFQMGPTYTFDTLIGHSKQSGLTNTHVNVSVQTLTISTNGSASTVLTIYFYDPDTQANFAFYSLGHVYFVDSAGIKYRGISANPSEVLLKPQQELTMSVTFPSLLSNITWLDLYFNTDGGSLVTSCIKLMPNDQTSSC